MRETRFALTLGVAILCGCGGPAGETAQVHAEANSVALRRLDDRIEVSLRGKPLTTFHFHSRWDKPFLHPLRTPSGRVISRGYPVDPQLGESKDHEWHRGLWFGHGDVNGEDFWREKADRTTARMIVVGQPSLRPNGLDVTLGLISRSGSRVGTLSESFTFNQEESRVFAGASIRIAADAGQSLKFGDTDDGGFALRLSDAFRQESGARLTNSAGGTGTEQLWGKPAAWVAYSATLDGGAQAGAILFDHPKNPRYPTRWHARPYALCSANPFGLRAFTGDAKDDGSWVLPAGESREFRYLVALHDGEVSADSAGLVAKRFAAGEFLAPRGR